MFAQTRAALAKRLGARQGWGGGLQAQRRGSALGSAQPAGFGSPSVELKGRDSLEVMWQDGIMTQLHPTWLRERCQSDATVDTSTLQPKANPHDLPEDLLLEAIELLAERDALQVSFNDGHTSEFSLAKLRAEVEGFCDSALQVPSFKRLQPKPWSASNYTLPVFQHGDIIDKESVKLALIEELITGGQALVRGVPAEEGEVVRFGQELSNLRPTNWGNCFNVRTKPDEAVLKNGRATGAFEDLAYTPKPIGFHTDGPYNLTGLDFQLLHAIDHCECPEGEAPCDGCSVMNYMVDGFYIAEKLRMEDPEAFDLLCQVPVRFENNGGDNSSAMVHVAPHFELEEDPQKLGAHKLKSIRFSGKSGQYAPPLEYAKLNAFYKARRRFSEMLHSGEDTLSLQFRPGDLLIFDNVRVLHARSEIAPTDGERWVQGCYIDRDGLWLNYERLRRRMDHA
mmetsp:Transcript_14417/g.42948  ORF Transcript_14417/g.42948 Transcript_14417/m.42948 type:complete len:452 (-) Transcript_14417:90-1445(-)